MVCPRHSPLKRSEATTWSLEVPTPSQGKNRGEPQANAFYYLQKCTGQVQHNSSGQVPTAPSNSLVSMGLPLSNILLDPSQASGQAPLSSQFLSICSMSNSPPSWYASRWVSQSPTHRGPRWFSSVILEFKSPSVSSSSVEESSSPCV